MSVLDCTAPLSSRNFAAQQSSEFGSFWGSGPPDFQLSPSSTALEAQAFSSIFSLDTTDLFHDQVESQQPLRREGSRKRKMSNREDPFREQQPKKRRETEPYPQPQYVAPSQLLTTSPTEAQSYSPLTTPKEGLRREASTGPAYDQRGQVSPAATYGHSQYLHPDADWSRSPQRHERLVLPSISSTPGYSGSPQLSTRPPSSYSGVSMSATYGPVVDQSPYGRSASYSYDGGDYHHIPPRSSQGPLPSADEASLRDSDERLSKPRCWDHGCNGKQFSTHSNYLRHVRERDGTSTKSYCPRCGAEFTRTTARNGHLAHAKCKPRRSPDPSIGGPSGKP